MTAPRKLAVIGLGVIAKFYLAAIEADPAFTLAAVCDLDEAALAAPRAAGIPGHLGHRELLAAHRDLDGAIVTVPNDAHAALCRDLLAAGLPVCVEKPLATELSDARALTAIAAERSLVLFTAFHRRYNSQVLELAAACAGTPVAKVKVRYFERIEDHIGQDAWYLDPARCGGGCVADNGPNAFDLVRLLFGESELSVVRAAITRDAAGLDRQAALDLVTAGPAPRRARVELDWSYPGELKDVEVTLADGRVLRSDLLAGHQGFKASLWHEYRGILTAFGATIERPAGRRDGGLAALDLVAAAYRLDRDDATHVFRPTAAEAR
ncbi:Gfo/Idh/MocA family oxidoreductase [Kitasatospora sp. NBC_01287]|uniref:Gfo/Idh/MocA family protein n=1 Tax=Kitasatospora sp. NBC_01287 TaxID=2903573 RepID=UPI002251E5A0|nr:Gfo/Idh/MocA family oxidoreductase [Kitasatospora sp. NBC_01287]MCX4747947.1 Gfo/Idh/MocA family oxidoreductase [Kitasatospora sp. NBC_01287]